MLKYITILAMFIAASTQIAKADEKPELVIYTYDSFAGE